MNTKPPRLLNKLFQWICSPDHFEELDGDLNERYIQNAKAFGNRKANWVYFKEMFGMLRPSVMSIDTRRISVNPYLWQSYFISAFRNMKRHKLFTSLNVIGLALSMSVGMLLISVIYDQLSFDTFHKDLDRLYRITTLSKYMDFPDEQLATTSMPLYEKIENLDVVESQVRIRRLFYGDVENDAKILPLYGHFAGTDFFNVFSFNLITGDKESALKEPFTIVLTQSSAEKLFGRSSPIGEVIKVGDYGDFTISGIMKDPPRNSHIQFEMLGSFSTIKLLERDEIIAPMTDTWRNVTSGYLYFKLRPDRDPGKFQEYLSSIGPEISKDYENWKGNYKIQKVSDITPGRDMINQIGPTMESGLLYIASALFIIVLLSALFNYSSLSLARGIRRAKEVGIRKVMGSTRSQIFWQFTIEAVTISLIALFLGYILLQLIKPEFYKIDSGLQRFVFLESNITIILLFILFAIIVGILAGVLPSIMLSKLESSRILKGIENLSVFRLIPFRKGLLIFQFALSLFFIIFSIQVNKQYVHATTFDLGLRKENIFNLPLQGNDPEIVRTKYMEMGDVDQVSFSSAILSTGLRNNSWASLTGKPDSMLIEFARVSPEYLPLHEIKIVEGRNFIEGPPEALVNEKFLELTSSNRDDILGSEITINNIGKYTITGITQDFHYAKIKEPIKGFILINSPSFQYANISLNQVDETTLSDLSMTWESIDEKVHDFRGEFYIDRINESYSFFSTMSRVVGFFSIISISIAVMGMLGMAIYSSEIKLKEISIRKILGASEKQIFRYVSSDYVVILFVASIISCSLIYLLFSQVLLPEMAQKAPLEIMGFVKGCSIIFVLSGLIIGSQLFKSIKTNPAQTLKSE